MKFQQFGDVAIKYVGEKNVYIEQGHQKIRTLIRFPDVLRVKFYFADPEAPFENTIAQIDNMRLKFCLPVNEFESLIDNAIRFDLFSKISIN